MDDREANVTPSARFRVKHPRAGYSGRLCGIDFTDGGGATDSATLAHAVMSEGCQVVDAETGKLAFGSEAAESQARIAEHAARWKGE